MRRRTFLTGAGLALSGGASAYVWQTLRTYPSEVVHPGRQVGHLARDHAAHTRPFGAPHYTADVAIVGSGAAALACAWMLERHGMKRWVMLRGPQPDGNLASLQWPGQEEPLQAPGAAHYLPLPSPESTHVRDLLADLGVLEGDPRALAPPYDERALVHAPEERLWFAGEWREGLLPTEAVDAREAVEHARFFARIDAYRTGRGADGRRMFTVPLALASEDPGARALDAISFANWLDREQLTSPTLRAYLDYTCRDDFGAGAAQVSAWAGLHYFCARNGHAANAHPGAVLTWPGGLGELAQRIKHRLQLDRASSRALDLTALRVLDDDLGVSIVATTTGNAPPVHVRAQRVVLACPLHIGVRIAPMVDAIVPQAERPQTASWLVGNFLLNGFPRERPGVPLAWDNVIHASAGLGYVVSTHQWLRQARPAQTIFTSYRALATHTPDEARDWLDRAPPNELLDAAVHDLRTAYGWRFDAMVKRAQVRALAHAMAIPTPGFLSRPGIAALRQLDGRVLYAHADLSGLSVFEEAAWWGTEAARRLLASQP